MKVLSPSKSIRKYCLECCNNSPKEVQLCTCYYCPLYRYRTGKKLDLEALAKLNPNLTEADINTIVFLLPAKTIRRGCEYCSIFSNKAIKNCEFTDCSLYSFRMGKNPNRKGIGGNKDFRID